MSEKQIDAELYRKAIDLIGAANQASVSLIQRRLRVGYTNAAKIVEQLEKDGHIGPYQGSKPREVHVQADKVPPVEKQKTRKRADSKEKAPPKGKTPAKKKTPQKGTQKAKTSREGVGGRNSLWETLGIKHKLNSIRGWTMQGATMDELAEMLGVGTTTLYKWQSEHAEFAEAIRAGRHVSNGELLNAAFKNSTGYMVKEKQAVRYKTYDVFTDPYTNEKVLKQVEKVKMVENTVYVPGNAKLLQFMLTNRMPEEYKNREHVEHAGSIGGNGYGYMTDEEIEAELQALEGEKMGDEPNVH